MNIQFEKYLHHAIDSLNDAEALYERGGYSGSINRAYYAIFYCVQGMLSARGTYPKSHKGISTKFSEHFIKPGLINKNFGAILKAIYNKRQFADYDIDSKITREEAKDSINNAKEFIKMTTDYFESHD